MKRRLFSFIGINFLRSSTLLSISFIFFLISIIILKGFQVINWEFITQPPKEFMTKGGIFPAIVGTFYLTFLSIIVASPIGILTGIFLVEYSRKNWFLSLIKITIGTLSGIPSIIFALFGLAIFVVLFRFGVSILSGGLTLAVMILPTIIKTTEEAIRTVPDNFREAAYALGAKKSETIIKVVLPVALPNILTGIIVSVGRAAGETAPILFTAATFYTRKLPKSIFEETMALPYHIYALMTEGTQAKSQVPIAYGTALVLLALVFLMNGFAIFIRYKMRRGKKW
uniref:Phosphate transport system permease protein PstA n=1 Tax=candidate division WOR-3 bacterium TaxID=2052148 RepID=A0A7C4Y6H6_UNCW3